MKKARLKELLENDTKILTREEFEKLEEAEEVIECVNCGNSGYYNNCTLYLLTLINGEEITVYFKPESKVSF